MPSTSTIGTANPTRSDPAPTTPVITAVLPYGDPVTTWEQRTEWPLTVAAVVFLGGLQLDAVVRRLAPLGVRSLTSTPPTLEEMFLRHYGDEETSGAKANAS
jgi:hypothetical protein